MRAFFLIMMITFLISGCYDKKELEEEAYVMAIGLDQVKDKKGKIKVTFQIANPEVGTSLSGASTQEPPEETISLIANDFLTARNTANSFVAREISLDHARVLIVSEDLARSDEFINVIQGIARARELKRQIQMIISKESAYDFINHNKPKLETRPHKYYQFMISRATETGIIPEATIHRFFQVTEGDADLFLGIYATSDLEESDIRNEDEYIAGEVPQSGGNKTQFMGSAVFKEGKMIDTLTGEETRICLILDNTLDIQDVLASYEDPNMPEYRIAARVISKKGVEVNIKYNVDKPSIINVTVPLNIEVLAIPSLVNYNDNFENQEKLKSSIEKALTEKTMKLIEKTQKEYKAEPFYWSLYVRKNFLTIKDYEAGDWNKKIYPHADINVDYNVKIISTGKTIRDSNLSEVRD